MNYRGRVRNGQITLDPSVHLPEGAEVYVEVLDKAVGEPESSSGILAFLDSLPDGPRSAGSWDELERLLHEEREAWGGMSPPESGRLYIDPQIFIYSLERHPDKRSGI